VFSNVLCVQTFPTIYIFTQFTQKPARSEATEHVNALPCFVRSKAEVRQQIWKKNPLGHRELHSPTNREEL
jgi:hypothetical protein